MPRHERTDPPNINTPTHGNYHEAGVPLPESVNRALQYGGAAIAGLIVAAFNPVLGIVVGLGSVIAVFFWRRRPPPPTK